MFLIYRTKIRGIIICLWLWLLQKTLNVTTVVSFRRFYAVTIHGICFRGEGRKFIRISTFCSLFVSGTGCCFNEKQMFQFPEVTSPSTAMTAYSFYYPFKFMWWGTFCKFYVKCTSILNFWGWNVKKIFWQEFCDIFVSFQIWHIDSDDDSVIGV